MDDSKSKQVEQMIDNNVWACVTDIVNKYDMYEEFEWKQSEDDDEMPEILECWIVTPFYGELLYEHGEPVIKRQLGYIWGRQTSGQAIWLDSVSWDIYEEREAMIG